MTTHVEVNGNGQKTSSAVTGGASAAPLLVVEAADPNEVMREQLEYLLDHAREGLCGCTACARYQRVRSVLLEIFN